MKEIAEELPRWPHFSRTSVQKPAAGFLPLPFHFSLLTTLRKWDHKTIKNQVHLVVRAVTNLSFNLNKSNVIIK